jgi:hypothetical protein
MVNSLTMIQPPHAMSSSKLAKPKRGLSAERAGLSFSGALDRQAFEVWLHRSTDFQQLQKRTYPTWGKTYFRHVAGSRGKGWVFWIHNPAGPDQFMRQVQAMVRPGDPPITEDDVKIVATEIAVDVRHPSNDPEILALAAQHFLTSMARLPAGHPRITVPPYFYAPKLAAAYAAAKADHAIATANARREGKAAPVPFQVKRGQCSVVSSRLTAWQALCDGLTINQGKAPNSKTGLGGDSYRLRIYVKTRDTRNGIAYAPLEPAEYCARIERTWEGSEVPYATINEWRNFRFESLANEHYSLVMPSADITPMARLLQERMVQLGRRPDSCKIRPSDRRKRRAFTCRDSFTNDKFRQALRALTRAQSCRNSVKTFPAMDLPPEAEGDWIIAGPKYSNNYSNTNPKDQEVMTSKSSMTGATQKSKRPVRRYLPRSHHDPPRPTTMGIEPAGKRMFGRASR